MRDAGRDDDDVARLQLRLRAAADGAAAPLAGGDRALPLRPAPVHEAGAPALDDEDVGELLVALVDARRVATAEHVREALEARDLARVDRAGGERVGDRGETRRREDLHARQKWSGLLCRGGGRVLSQHGGSADREDRDGREKRELSAHACGVRWSSLGGEYAALPNGEQSAPLVRGTLAQNEALSTG